MSEQPVRVLVVDDEPALRHTVSRILGEEGYEVSTASDGEDALAKAAEVSPAIILSDLRMPRLGGLELLDRYRASGGSALVIAMTAYGDVETAIDAMRRGAYDYIAEPLNRDAFSITVRRALETSQLRRELRAHIHEQRVRFGRACRRGRRQHPRLISRLR